MFRYERLLQLFNLMAPLGIQLHNFWWNPLDVLPQNPSFFIIMIFKFITKLPAKFRQLIVINLSRVSNRTAHLQTLQSLVFPVGILRHIHDHIMSMQLRIQSTAGIMMKLSINDLPGYFIIIREYMISGS